VAAEPLLSLRPAGAQSESRSEEADLVARAQGGDERALASRNDADLLVSALAALALVDREILIAREIEGAADLEIARRLGLSVTALRVRVHRARRMLRAVFQEEPR